MVESGFTTVTTWSLPPPSTVMFVLYRPVLTGDAARVETLETEIDALVYALYGLTEPEIALIENRA